MTLYGAPEEDLMATSDDPTVKKIWNQKLVNDAIDIQSVYEGTKIVINWKNVIDSIAFVQYSTPDRKPLIHIRNSPIYARTFKGWAFYKFNPWKAKYYWNLPPKGQADR